MTETKPRRTCVLVLGMHRSGTSAITRMISLIGAELPKTVMIGGDSNEAGHWEPRPLVELNDRMLVDGGSAWNDWRPFDPDAALGPERAARYRAEIQREIEAQFAGKALFVLKDPRISRFAPLYLDALRALGIGVKVVLMSRHPFEVAQSLGKRDAMPWDYAMRLWLRHDLDAEAATRDAERIVLSYESAMNDPDAAILRLRELLASATPEDAIVDLGAARASMRRDLRHHGAAALRASVAEPFARWAEAAIAAFAVLERDADDERGKAALSALAAELDEDLRLNGESLAYCLRDALRIRAELTDVTRQRNVMIERESELEKMVRSRDASLRQLHANLAELRRQRVIDLARALRPDFGDALPKQLSPWRSLNAEKRKRARQRREDYLTVLNSPLFDADYYLRTYPDVAGRGEDPILHYLSHGSSEGRWPSAAVDPIECKTFFPELDRGEGNLVLRLIALLGPETEES